ncbi:hypothetical protein GCM10023188_22390 [Pontibacter saemangeumensis]|uniref:Uncharacterized protein n=2 Tax=Pontibacter saemangeumensis TaxID=1084525 RepID=A0ABP8LQI5_9BACT
MQRIKDIPLTIKVYHKKMLEYIKTILLKVSFDKMLFEKELRKAFKVLAAEELQQLKQWCYDQFSGMYLLILNKVFTRSQA